MSSKYEFIDGEKAHYPVVAMCRWARVSRSGFYEWRDRPGSATEERRTVLAQQIRDVFDDSDETYGYRRVWAELARRGVEAGPELVRALMRTAELVACQPRPWRLTTIADPAAPATPDLVCRDFTAEAVGIKFVGDITYIPTWEGFVYLATVIDCHSKMVAGYALADHMRASLVCDAIAMAARTVRIAPDAIFHSDRGRPVHVGGVPESVTRQRYAPVRGPYRGLLGQRPRGVVQRGVEERARLPDRVSDKATRHHRRHPLHRAPLQ